MKKTIIVILIYLAGCVVAYKTTKVIILEIKYRKEWLVRDQITAVLFSTFSWGTVVANAFVYGVMQIDSNKPAKW